MNTAKTLLIAIAAILPAACGTVSGHLGVPIGQENAAYKVEGAGGVIAEISPDGPAASRYRYGFTILLKQAPKVASVRVERVEGDKTETVIDDSRNPTVNGTWQAQQPQGAQSYLHGKGTEATTWVGQTAARDMTEKNAPWLYHSGTTHQHYRITIRDMQGKETVFEQPTMIPAYLKRLYFNIWKKQQKI